MVMWKYRCADILNFLQLCHKAWDADELLKMRSEIGLKKF
jgi:hypothetical protein